MRSWVIVGFVVGALVWRCPALADEPRGFEVNASLGYAAPFGGAEQLRLSGGSDPAGEMILPTDLSAWFAGAIPLRLGLGWRSPRVFVGATLQYAWTIVASSPGSVCGRPNDCGGPGSDVVIGPGIDWHFLPAGPIDPWLGGAIAIESASFDVNGPSEAAIPLQQKVNAVGWIATWQLGFDAKIADHVRGGPFVAFAFGQWTGPHEVSHEWLSAGLRLVFDTTELKP